MPSLQDSREQTDKLKDELKEYDPLAKAKKEILVELIIRKVGRGESIDTVIEKLFKAGLIETRGTYREVYNLSREVALQEIKEL